MLNSVLSHEYLWGMEVWLHQFSFIPSYPLVTGLCGHQGRTRRCREEQILLLTGFEPLSSVAAVIQHNVTARKSPLVQVPSVHIVSGKESVLTSYVLLR
jgi:hypothetical protein